jgi:hypothetical protein
VICARRSGATPATHRPGRANPSLSEIEIKGAGFAQVLEETPGDEQCEGCLSFFDVRGKVSRR